MIFGGDFRQILPVIKQGTRVEIVDSCINKSRLWSNVKSSPLTINTRVLSLNNDVNARYFSNYLLKLGEGWEN